MQYAIFASILLKSVAFLIYILDLKKECIFWIKASIFIQGLCHSLIELFFHVWINHFLFWNLFSLSISIGASPLSNIFGNYISKSGSISDCSKELFKFISVLDLIFFVTTCYYNKHFNLSYSKVKNEEKYDLNENKNDEFKKKMNYKYLKSMFSKKYDFFSIA